MDPAELLELLARLPQHTQHGTIQRQLVNTPGKGVGGVKHLVRARRDADRPGRARRHRAGGAAIPGRDAVAVRNRADRRPGARRYGNVDHDLPQELPVRVENLDAAVAAVRDVDVVVCVDGDAVWRVELAWPVAGRAERPEPGAVRPHFGDAGVDVAVADVAVAAAIPGDVGHLPEPAIDRRGRRLGMLHRPRVLVRCFLLAAEHHGDAPLRRELDHHVRPFVGGPDVILRVDLHGVRE